GAKIPAHSSLSEPEFVKCAVRMLEAIASSWCSFLRESAIPAMVPDVVGNLAQANLEVWDGLRDQLDCCAPLSPSLASPGGGEAKHRRTGGEEPLARSDGVFARSTWHPGG